MPAATPSPRRLVLPAAEFAYLVAKTGVDLPPQWRPAPDTPFGRAESELVKKRVLQGVGEAAEVHPSVQRNLEVLAEPTVMLDTVATVGGRGLRALHAVSGPLGASLFDLGDGAVELSLFAAVQLGRELIRAVPAEEAGIGSSLDDPAAPAPLSGRVPLGALREMGAARLLRDADPEGPAAVLAELKLPAAEARLAEQVASRSDGALRCLVIGRGDDGVRSSQVTWLHSDAGWSGVAADPDGSGRRMVRLKPAAREDLGTWVAPAVAEALS